jgi:hypothetical protein
MQTVVVQSLFYVVPTRPTKRAFFLKSALMEIESILFGSYLLISKNRFSDIRKYLSLFDIRKWFSDIKNSNFWYLKMIFLYQKFEFLISENLVYFLISQNLFFDIRKWISWYQKFFILFWNQKMIFWYQKMIFWYQKFDFLISIISFLISENTSKILKRRLINASI